MSKKTFQYVTVPLIFIVSFVLAFYSVSSFHPLTGTYRTTDVIIMTLFIAFSVFGIMTFIKYISKR